MKEADQPEDDQDARGNSEQPQDERTPHRRHLLGSHIRKRHAVDGREGQAAHRRETEVRTGPFFADFRAIGSLHNGGGNRDASTFWPRMASGRRPHDALAFNSGKTLGTLE